MSQDDDDYAPTSERMEVPSHFSSPGDYLIYLFHAVAYDYAAQRVGGLRVLDYGCGTGYGSHRLSAAAVEVVGVDVSGDAVRYARSHYESPHLEFQRVEPAETAPLPYPDGSFDAVISFQVIEHVPSTDVYLAEVARVLRPGGLFLCATPERGTRLFRHQRPWNRWHLDEFSSSELTDRVGRHLVVQQVLGMTSRSDVIGLELRRCRTLRWAALPFTFPGAPEAWRVAGLESLRVASTLPGRLRGRLRGRRGPAGVPPETVTPAAFAFGPDDIVLAEGASPSTNTVLVAVKAGPPDVATP